MLAGPEFEMSEIVSDIEYIETDVPGSTIPFLTQPVVSVYKIGIPGTLGSPGSLSSPFQLKR